MKKFDFDFYKNRKILFGISIGEGILPRHQ